MADFDPFAELIKPFSHVVLHNVKVLDVQPAPEPHETNGRAVVYEVLTVERHGRTETIPSGSPWSAEWSSKKIGQHGYLQSARSNHGGPPGGCYFRDYPEQTLRRVPELDTATGHGWICDAAPRGLLAPAGLIPGASGRFVPDETIEVTVKVPPEFVRECKRVELSPADVLKGFIGDLAGLQNFNNCPRADGYGSNGSDERDKAEDWFQRAYGIHAINLEQREAEEDERRERREACEDFGDLLDDFLAYGGAEGDLRAAVETLIDQQRAKSEAEDGKPGQESP